MNAYPPIRRRILRDTTSLLEDSEIQTYFQYESTGHDLSIDGYVLPHIEPYTHSFIKARITFPLDYPFKEPKLKLLTYIYHPDVTNTISNPDTCTGGERHNWHPHDPISKVR
ncbi:unnamed protein product [Rotaria magnacalcarata]|uniref:UBC core domain-containing protein n=1 Tax=Rotaria magnacalcarata TaxID=392030 RepID=A0A819T2R8_9BILA|nr:unnamed protein product [Rotaria magnacalcarata]CAF2153554.1 unnamed protein product [Rotaria magnacalcarata]CAF4017139.1 unnamed protein product [Rotaria magnacalcarata]CAF4071896.1 unnamed protein product [Rotaria magnacalcarata]